MSKRKHEESEYSDAVLAATGSLSIKSKKPKPAGNGMNHQQLAYEAMYRDNIRLKHELESVENRYRELEEQMRAMKRKYDELDGRHTMMMREMPNTQCMALYPNHAMMYANPSNPMHIDGI
tara:strand:+ start:86 stop:448 length:363 start_codon:yes stop_codon:yes gene_type:complete